MDQPPQKQKLVSPLRMVADAICVILFGIYMYSVMSTHVPSDDPKWILIGGLFTTACMCGVFWLALQMFWVTFNAHRAARKNQSK